MFSPQTVLHQCWMSDQSFVYQKCGDSCKIVYIISTFLAIRHDPDRETIHSDTMKVMMTPQAQNSTCAGQVTAATNRPARPPLKWFMWTTHTHVTDRRYPQEIGNQAWCGPEDASCPHAYQNRCDLYDTIFVTLKLSFPSFSVMQSQSLKSHCLLVSFMLGQ